MFTNHIIGIFFALASAISWGGGDYSGGLAMRRSKQFHALAISLASGLAIIILFVVFLREPFPPINMIIWPICAGAVGSIGLGSLYMALSDNQSAIVAPASAVIGTAIPVIYGSFKEGLPGPMALAGFGVALVGIWLVSQTSKDNVPLSKKGLFLTILAGLGFGGFFLFLAQVEKGYVFTPLIISRSTAIVVSLLLILISREGKASFLSNPVALLAGVLDAGGNVLYMFSRQYTREDIAVVLSSLYPAINVLLAWMLLKEKVSRLQWVGVLLCVAAVGLISA